MPISVRIDGHLFPLVDDADLTVLKRQVLDAIMSGPGFVDFVAVGHGAVSVLITVHSRVQFTVTDAAVLEELEWPDIESGIELGLRSFD